MIQISFDYTNKDDVASILQLLGAKAADVMTTAVEEKPKTKPVPETNTTVSEPPPHTDADAPHTQAKQEEKQPEKNHSRAALQELAAGFLSQFQGTPKLTEQKKALIGVLQDNFGAGSTAALKDADIPAAYKALETFINGAV